MKQRFASLRYQKFDQEKIKRSKELRKEPTQAEKELWRLLRENNLAGYKFRRQQIISGFIVDFCNAKTGLIIELDGEVHDENPAYDHERDAILECQGYTVIRFRNQELYSCPLEVLEKILGKLQELEKE